MSVRKPFIAGNWKMNGTIRESVTLASALREQLGDIGEQVEVVVCPPYLALSAVSKVLAGSAIKLGAQDVHWSEKGAFTGEVSPPMLREVECSYVIIGHSERRHLLGETNDIINKKVKAALAHQLFPILCVGELLEERSMGVTKEVVKRQIEKGLENVPAGDVAKVVVAYEPVWAIGTGKNATPKQAQDVHFFIRNLLSKLVGEETAARVRIQYGGSVKPENIKELMAQTDIDGALVGGASLDVDGFVKIVKG